MNRGYFTVVGFRHPAGDIKQPPETVVKYHDIMNIPSKIEAFMKFLEGSHAIQYANFYYKAENKSEKGRNFAFRRYVNRSS